MATVGRGRGRGGVPGGGGPNGGMNGRGGGPPAGDGPNTARRGSWRGGPPGSAGSFAGPRVGSPASGGSASPRPSINDQWVLRRGRANGSMFDMKKAQDDKRPGKGFQTDSDISGQATPSHRELQPWSPDAAGPDRHAPNGANGAGARANGSNGGPPSGSGRDSETFGAAGGGKTWDQFETNARLFGTKTSYQEEIYTTKLNRSGPDFKKREKEAEKLANEILNGTSANPHVLEERDQVVEDWTKDEEEKYSGVARNPNAYVPPAARRAQGQGAMPPAAAGLARPPQTATIPFAPPTAKANGGSPAPTPGSLVAEASSAVLPPALTPTTAASAHTTAPQAETPPPAPASTAMGLARSSNEAVAASGIAMPAKEEPAAGVSKTDLEASATPAPSVADAKDSPHPGVVDSFRQFMGSERERAEAKKQSIAKSEREKQLADLKRFHTSFKVPLPMPKDILSILSKDEEKQKAIEAHAAQNLQSAKAEAEARKEAKPSPAVSAVKSPDPSKASPAKPNPPKKIVMSIAEIPPFNATKRKPPAIPVPETAGQSIPMTSPTPSQGAEASSSAQAKLNPKASAFVFKPTAAAFKPGQSSTSASPAPKTSQIASPAAGPSVPAAPAAARNPFFGDRPIGRFAVNPKDDFNPWRHGAQVPAASAVAPSWPYTGRSFHFNFAPHPAHTGMMYSASANLDEDASSPHGRPPPLMQGYPPGVQYPPNYYRMSGMGQGGMPTPIQHANPAMFSPQSAYSQLPGGMQQSPHMSGAPAQPNGMPIYFQNGGMSQNPQFMSPQHVQYNTNTPQRHGPGPGMGPVPNGAGGPGMYYHSHMSPHHTPQLQHNMPFPSQTQFQPSPMQQPNQVGGPGPGPGSGPGQGYEGGGPPQPQQQQHQQPQQQQQQGTVQQ